MVPARTTTSDFTSKLTALKQEQFSGQVLLKSLSGQEWLFYLYLGRILYATGGTHPVRRLRRNLKAHCPQTDLRRLKPLATLSSSSAEAFNISWEYQLLYLGVEHQKITREQAAKIIGAIVAEVLFDVTQAVEVTSQVKPENYSCAQLVLLDAGQAIAEVEQVWQTWRKAKIADRSPNRAPMIKQPEQLQQQTSASLYQVLTRLLDGQRTLRDLSVKMRRDVVEVTCSLLPYIQSGLVELIDIPDLPSPISPTSPVIPSPEATPPKPLVACVDDSPAVCRCMEKILTTADYQFLAVQDSPSAIATLLNHKPDLIFLDAVMPNITGYEICTQLRKISDFRDTPIIILSSNDGIIDQIRAKMVGASSFLSKPIAPKTVLAVAQQHLKNSFFQ